MMKLLLRERRFAFEYLKKLIGPRQTKFSNILPATVVSFGNASAVARRVVSYVADLPTPTTAVGVVAGTAYGQ